MEIRIELPDCYCFTINTYFTWLKNCLKMRKFHENTTNYPELSVMPNFSHLTTHHQDTKIL